MAKPSVKKNSKIQNSEKISLKKIILIALLVMLASLIAWHLLVPVLGITFAFTETVVGAAIATIIIICVSSLLFFLFTGIGIFIVGLTAFLWCILTIALFPLLFPILIPILLLMLVVGFVARKR